MSQEKEKKEQEFEKFDTPLQAVFKNFFRNKLAVTGLLVFIFIFGFVFIGSGVSEFKPYFDQPVLRNIKPGFGYLNFPSEIQDKNILKN